MPMTTHQSFASTASLALLAVAAATLSSTSDAWPKFKAFVPNGNNVEFNKVDLGHKEGNMLRNAFGLAFNVDRNWTKELCEADSDGDGQTNGQELGDPCCIWTPETANATWETGMSNPGNKSSKSDPSLWKDLDCTTLTPKNITAAAAEAQPSATSSAAPPSALTVVVGASTLLVAAMATMN